jgi:hypothetical protein
MIIVQQAAAPSKKPKRENIDAQREIVAGIHRPRKSKP